MIKEKKGLLIWLSTALIVFSSFTEANSTLTQNRQSSASSNRYISTNFIDLICERVYSRFNSHRQTFKLYSNLKAICDEVTSQVKKTGQTISYYPKDDGDYQKGLTPHYERDDENEIVIDHVTKLQWQDNESAETDLIEGYYSALNIFDNYDKIIKFLEVTGSDRSSLDAEHYCMSLNLGGYHDWRVPKLKELLSIVDFGRSTPSINPIFENTASASYWTSNSYGYNADYRWGVDFATGIQDVNRLVNHKIHIRCVREGE